MNNQNIGIFIKKLREEKNITQQELADKLHISRQAVSKWELGKAMPDYTILVILSELFNVTIDELIMGEKNPKENVSLKLYKEKNKLVNKLKITFNIIILLIFIFLGYYFFNQFNSNKIYKIYGSSSYINIVNGVFIETRDKIYFNLGNLVTNQNIEKVDIVDKSGGGEKLIYSSNELDIMFNDYLGYEKYFDFSKLNDTKNSLYIKIYFEDKISETKLILKEDYKNNKLFFLKKDKYNSLVKVRSKYFGYDSLIDYLKKNSNSSNNYEYIIKDNDYEYVWNYYEDIDVLMLNENKDGLLIGSYIFNSKDNLITYTNYENNFSYYYTPGENKIYCITETCFNSNEEINKLDKLLVNSYTIWLSN